MKKVINITLPVYWTNVKKTKKDTTHLISMNWYRNAHYHIKSHVKNLYHTLIADQVNPGLAIKGKYVTKYKYYYKNKASDGSNVVSMIEKFTLDGLQEIGMIEEDSVLFHSSEGFACELDKDNPRIEIEIKSIDEN